MGVSNAVAGGMMLAASFSLIREGVVPRTSRQGPFGIEPWEWSWLGSVLGTLVTIDITRAG